MVTESSSLYQQPDPARLHLCPGGPAGCGTCPDLECQCWCHVMWPRQPYPNTYHPADCRCMPYARGNSNGHSQCWAGACYVCRQPLPGGKMMDVCEVCRPVFELRTAEHLPPPARRVVPKAPPKREPKPRAKYARKRK